MRTEDELIAASDIRDLFTPLPQALAEIDERRKDPVLRKKIVDFLQGDIPDHFISEQPLFYVARYLATPSYEVLRCVEIGKLYKMPVIIGEDVSGTFFADNELKRALGKLSVVKEIAHNKDEITENFTIVDFKAAQKKPFSSIVTINGESLVLFHHRLFSHMYPGLNIIHDESSWVDRNYRGDLLELYKRTLSLLLIHGIMFESYIASEIPFALSYVKPAFSFIEREFGCRPLIYEHIPQKLELERNWNAYPRNLYPFIAKEFQR